MNQLSQRTVWINEEDHPSALTPQELAAPIEVLQRFFETYTLPQAKQYLWSVTKYQLIDIDRPTKEMRPIYFQFINSLDKIIDVAWLLDNNYYPKTTYGPKSHSKAQLKTWRNDDFISFLTPYQCNHPAQAINLFFNYDSLCFWKKCRTDEFKKIILDPRYNFFFDSQTLKEFEIFTKLAMLIEALFVYLGHHITQPKVDTKTDETNWLFEPSENPTAWLTNLVNEEEQVNIHQRLANLCYTHRYSHDWNCYNTFILLNDYQTILRLIYTYRLQLFNDTESASSTTLRKLKNQLKNWPIGRITRFLTGLILGSPTFREGYVSYKAPQQEIVLMTQLIHSACLK